MRVLECSAKVPCAFIVQINYYLNSLLRKQKPINYTVVHGRKIYSFIVYHVHIATYSAMLYTAVYVYNIG